MIHYINLEHDPDLILEHDPDLNLEHDPFLDLEHDPNRTLVIEFFRLMDCSI